MLLSRLEENQFIEIFDLSRADDTIFGNYKRYDFFQLVWFTHVGGDPTYFLDFEEYKIHDNQIVVIYPGQIDRLDVRCKQGYVFAIRSDIFFNINQRLGSAFRASNLSNTFITPDAGVQKILKSLLQLMLLEYGDKRRPLLMESYLEAFVFHVISASEDPESTSNNGSDSVIAQMMKLIDENFIAHGDTEFYAVRLGLSCKRLNETSRKGTGKTVKQHIQERLALEAKREIHLARKSLKEIAFDLGFSEQAYFTRFFRQHTGMAPSEFKQAAHSSKY
ncbi:helix-turn-helix domain-containing protein [uncultured Alistipes sp.]|jgi:transcriptional regulator, araC family|uniref:helix-turn-helix domain-containing protein n=1 Tax=uncultured Alistipes sp. TaxID=538949 RepID=UPI0025D435E2|nr:helix-turn-helix domain-containing protein [uncultured Alistipes sp.]